MTGEHRRIADRYRLDGVLGRGGMSVVHQGYDERLDRPVAIKLLRPHAVLDPDVPGAEEAREAQARDRERFLREIRTTARLELPGTPAVYDTGVEESPTGSELWLVMQLLRGSTLESVLDRTEAADLALARGAAVAAQIAAVLADVHRVDIVHRDIKPANVVIVGGGLVKVLDFGIAILRGGGALPRLTQVDRTVGTPDYMSPEQSVGRPVTAASDVYSLGCVLVELLTGDPPFLGTDSFPVRARHLQSPPPSIRDRRRDLPAALDELVLMMLAKDADVRPTAEEAYDALTPWCVGDQLTDAVDDEQDPTRPFRRPLLAPPSKPTSPAAAGPPLTDAELEALEAQASVLLADGRPQEAVQRVGEALARSAHDEYAALQLRHCWARTLFAAGEFRRTAPVFVEVGRQYRRFLGPVNELSLDCDHDGGLAYAEVGEHDEALPLLRRFLEQAPDHDDRIVGARMALVAMLAAVGRGVDAVAELAVVRVQVVDLHGSDATQVRAVDRQLKRLRGVAKEAADRQLAAVEGRVDGRR